MKLGIFENCPITRDRDFWDFRDFFDHDRGSGSLPKSNQFYSGQEPIYRKIFKVIGWNLWPVERSQTNEHRYKR